MENMNDRKTCSCPHHKVLPVAVILIGLAFLLQNLNILTAGEVGIIWPILLIIAGAVKLGGCTCCANKHNHQ
jgi:hypothetical protein